MNKSTIPSRSKFAVLRQICNLIPGHLVPKLARETGMKTHGVKRMGSHLNKQQID
jgi:chromate transport protein ChrA